MTQIGAAAICSILSTCLSCGRVIYYVIAKQRPYIFVQADGNHMFIAQLRFRSTTSYNVQFHVPKIDPEECQTKSFEILISSNTETNAQPITVFQYLFQRKITFETTIDLFQLYKFININVAIFRSPLADVQVFVVPFQFNKCLIG